MKRFLILSAWLAGLGSGLGSTAQAAALANQMPAGALFTLETRKADGLLGRFADLLAGMMGDIAGDKKASAMLDEFKGMLSESVANEAVLGVFVASQGKKLPAPQVLGVSRVSGEAEQMLKDTLNPRPGAKVGNYSFWRQGKTFTGMSGGLLYFSTDKALLMDYLGRLSGKTAPRLGDSLAYTAPTRTVGQQEVSLFMDFSATAKLVRSYLGPFPRLLSPVVDALDTLGQYAAGLTSTEEGLNTVSALAANSNGKDKPLYNMLTHTTEFHVQDIIPADVEAVSANACAPETPAYLGRWLTRLDLFDVTGFLSDSQLASHLEKSGQYLGDECAQVALAGSFESALKVKEPAASLQYSVTYQRVRDMDAAKAHMPQYAASVNTAIAGLGHALTQLIQEDGLDSLSRNLPKSALPKQMAGAGKAGQEALVESLGDIKAIFDNLKLVYAFRGDYLITAYSQEALQAALDESAPALGQSADFQAAKLNMQSAGWSYQTDLPDLSAEDILAQIPELQAALGANADEEDPLADVNTENLSEEQRAVLEEMKAAPGAGDSGMVMTAVGAVTDLINRYDGLTSQKMLNGSIIATKSSLKYRW